MSERIADVDAERTKLQKEYDGFLQALGDPTITAWVGDREQRMPRKLTTFEIATIKRIASLEPKLDALDDEYEDLCDDVLMAIAGVPGEPDDPEVLLHASLVTINRAHKAGHATPESKVVLRALLMYLKSLKSNDD